MDNLSKHPYVLLIIRSCILITAAVFAAYCIIQLRFNYITDGVTREWLHGIAIYCIWFFFMPSLVIVIGVLLKITYLQWIILLWDVVFIVLLAISFPRTLYFATPIALLELVSLFLHI